MEGWQQMDRKALDDAYANASYIPDGASYPGRWAEAARTFRAAHPPERIAYADRSGAALDLFLPSQAPSGLVTFIHGGYWRAFGPSDWSHLAAGALARGHAFAVIGYRLAPEARIGEITALARTAIDVIATRVPGPVHLTGHSAGGHLAARLVMPDAAPACADRVAACVPISPLADLRPLLAQSLNADLRLDEEEAVRESPALGRPNASPRIAVHVGAAERPSFLWQAGRLVEAWDVPLRVEPGRHHFDVIDGLTDPTSPLLTDLLGPA
jgi:acetyl esterase/lipase